MYHAIIDIIKVYQTFTSFIWHLLNHTDVNNVCNITAYCLSKKFITLLTFKVFVFISPFINISILTFLTVVVAIFLYFKL